MAAQDDAPLPADDKHPSSRDARAQLEAQSRPPGTAAPPSHEGEPHASALAGTTARRLGIRARSSSRPETPGERLRAPFRYVRRRGGVHVSRGERGLGDEVVASRRRAAGHQSAARAVVAQDDGAGLPPDPRCRINEGVRRRGQPVRRRHPARRTRIGPFAGESELSGPFAARQPYRRHEFGEARHAVHHGRRARLVSYVGAAGDDAARLARYQPVQRRRPPPFDRILRSSAGVHDLGRARRADRRAALRRILAREPGTAPRLVMPCVPSQRVPRMTEGRLRDERVADQVGRPCCRRIRFEASISAWASGGSAPR